MTDEIKNASQSQKPNFYYARHMQPGTCRYDKEMILVDTDAMMQMIGTGAGIPVYIHHQVNVPIDQVKEKAAGYVTESFYNELDGWAWFKFMAIDDEIRLAKSNGWSVSDAYRPTNWAVGGTKNNVAYDREIVGGEFTHLAIVPNPRYEEACFMTPDEFKAYQEGRKAKLAELQNSNPSPSKGNPIMKLFSFKKQEVTNSAEATHVELADGKLVTLEEAAQLLNGKTVKKNADEDEDKKKADKLAEEKENEMFDVDGVQCSMKDMKNAVRSMRNSEKKNAEDEAKRKDEEKKNAEKKNAEDEAKKAEEKKNADEEAAKKKKDEDEKTNGKGFYEQLCNAHEIAQNDGVVIIETASSEVARGKNRYG